MRFKLPEILFSAVATVSIAGSPRPECGSSSSAIAIEHASVITMADSIVHHDYTVVTDGGLIVSVGPSPRACIPAGARHINARGMFLMPGLADMHVHMDADDTTLYVANGITQVREMNGTPALLSLRGLIRNGKTLGPSMYVTGPLLAGVKQRWRHVLVETPDSAIKVVSAEARAGYDAVKVYDGLSMATYRAIVSQAAREGLTVVGHIPAEVGLDSVLAAKQRSIEHLDQIITAASRAPHDANDSVAIAETAKKIARAGSWVTPTIAAEYALNTTGTTGYAKRLERPEMQYQDSGTFTWWKSLAAGHGGSELSADEFRSERAKQYFETKLQLLRELDRAGVKMLAGTDTPNPLMVPGFSLADELTTLTRAGLSNYRVLRMATSDAAEFIGGNFGIIAPRRRADLILLSANPLSDLNTIRNPRAVMVRGRWLDRELDSMLSRRRSLTAR